ncbi:30S ribosomal protein S1 [Rhodothermus marinus]|uniref:Small ribosomal subunit protein bS1 n=1 Tax=Rhodothermus marinus (strain ATCC 43812 / DSM 4252 / R-10) TaxID=518766 RepID=D0MI74_RHOM4|nr:30S ribosomal protein S1 [Rhodothermus marinus]ACY48182.1 ribosomal protein S1 [Rhodothermus marinus DSM 4252]
MADEQKQEQATQVSEMPETPEKPQEEAPQPEAETATTPEAAQPEAAETPEATGAPVAEAEAEPEPVAEAPAQKTRPVLGFKGEITGPVVKLEDLEKQQEAREVDPFHEQLLRQIEESFTTVNEGEIVKGRILAVGEKEVIIDIGFKSTGIVSRNEFGDAEIKPGDEVEVFVERLEDAQGQLVLSKLKADRVRRWERVEDAYYNEKVIEGTIVRRVKGGMIAEIFDGLEAFLPGSQIDVRPVRDFDAYIGKRMEFKIVKINPANENVVVSHRALLEKELQKQREEILSKMEPGQVLEGTVKNITDFGVFIDLGGVDGLLHITDLSWGRVSHPSELVQLGQKLNVVVLDYDKERQRISLGLKQLQPHPWENIDEKYKEGDVVEGKVVSITDYGAFVELEKGIEGLVHISEMSWTDHIKHPSQKVSLGQLVKVKILNIDREGRKISLGMKQLEPNPWEGLSKRYPPGTVLRGKVRKITNFGVFVEIEPGIDGLVHISDLSWTRRIQHPSEVVKEGEELDVVVLEVDEENRRISLGHKQVQTNPWNDFATVYAEGTDHKARVVRIEDNGLVVELPLGVEAFVPAGELKHSKNFQEFYHVGDELELRVVRFSAADREIVMSEVAKERAEEEAQRAEEERRRREERKQQEKAVKEYQRKAVTGPTTLGELSGLEDLKAQLEAAEKAAQEASAETEEAPEQPAAEAQAPEAETGEEPSDETSEDKKD